MRKKCFVLLLVLLALVVALPLGAGAEERPLSGSCGDRVTWSYNEATATLTISGTGPMTDYERIKEYEDVVNFPWRQGESGDPLPFTKLVVENGVTSLGDWAFCRCEALTQVTLPNSLTAIGDQAFIGTGLTEIIIPDSVTDLGSRVFYDCQSLRRAVLPDTLTVVPSDLFVECKSLVDAPFPAMLEEIGDGAYHGTALQGTLTIPGRVRKVGNFAFQSCHSLTKVVVEEGVQELGRDCFTSCGRLKELELPDTLPTLGEGCFSKCGFESVRIPGSLEVVPYGLFAQCGNLKTAVVEEGVRMLGILEQLNPLNGVFSGCPQLEEVQLPDSLEWVGKLAFANCGLKSITIPEGVTWLGDKVFYHSTALEEVLLPRKELSHIGAEAFAGCTALKTVRMPREIWSIDARAFQGCTALERIEISGNSTVNLDLGEALFLNCSSLREVVFLPGVYQLSRYTFEGCSALREVYFPLSMSSIAANCFDTAGSAVAEPLTVYYEGNQEQLEQLAITPIGNEPLFEAGFYLGVRLMPTPFRDVFLGDYYADAVEWALATGITSGETATTFGPKSSCTRGQIVTFLWRAAGEPEPLQQINPFTDVSPKNYYYKAVLWAVENGITAGTTPTTFSPKESCTRAQAVTFLWRFDGEPAPQRENSGFSDVKPGSYYADAVEWAVEHQVTKGTSSTAFSPYKPCTRGQIVSFLYRYAMAE